MSNQGIARVIGVGLLLFSAIIMAIRATNSGKPGPLKAGAAGSEAGAVIGGRCGLWFAGASLHMAAAGDFHGPGC
jgi:hypothetical protein